MSPHTSPKGKSKEITAPVSWSDQDIDILLDFVLKKKAKAGDGLNFSIPFWNGISLALPQPARRLLKLPRPIKRNGPGYVFFSGN